MRPNHENRLISLDPSFKTEKLNIQELCNGEFIAKYKQLKSTYPNKVTASDDARYSEYIKNKNPT